MGFSLKLSSLKIGFAMKHYVGNKVCDSSNQWLELFLKLYIYIYILWRQYVGKSETQFKKRHSNHKQEIKNQVGGLGHYYGGSGGCGYQNISIIIIEEVETKTRAYLAEREVFWQHQLRVYVENGSNGHCYRKEVWVWRGPAHSMEQYVDVICYFSFGLLSYI